MVIEEIKSILEKNGYEVNLDTVLRINTMTESIRDDNQIKQLLKIENFVGPHIRGIISYL